MTTVAIPDELAADLLAFAERNGQSLDDSARQAIVSFLEDHEDIAIATERLRTPEGTISLGELKKSLGLDSSV